jgi:hypothetical protein
MLLTGFSSVQAQGTPREQQEHTQQSNIGIGSIEVDGQIGLKTLPRSRPNSQLIRPIEVEESQPGQTSNNHSAMAGMAGTENFWGIVGNLLSSL